MLIKEFEVEVEVSTKIVVNLQTEDINKTIEQFTTQEIIEQIEIECFNERLIDYELKIYSVKEIETTLVEGESYYEKIVKEVDTWDDIMKQKLLEVLNKTK